MNYSDHICMNFWDQGSHLIIDPSKYFVHIGQMHSVNKQAGPKYKFPPIAMKVREILFIAAIIY